MFIYEDNFQILICILPLPVKAMRYLREFNIAHMDLKPQNILLTSEYNPTLKIAGNMDIIGCV